MSSLRTKSKILFWVRVSEVSIYQNNCSMFVCLFVCSLTCCLCLGASGSVLPIKIQILHRGSMPPKKVKIEKENIAAVYTLCLVLEEGSRPAPFKSSIFTGP